MHDNPVQFAVVREDPTVEAEIIRAMNAEKILLIGSGGCKALTLQALFPNLGITLVDSNPAQIALIRQKTKQLSHGSVAERNYAFNIGDDSPAGLNACGNFESLFRSLRRFINDFIVSEREMRDLFSGSIPAATLTQRVFGNKYWKIAFDLHFKNSFLEALFGPAAVQHAPPGSYPDYFRVAFEKGLTAPGMQKNYFLHHVFLGCYLADPESLPHYLVAKVPKYRFDFVEGTTEKVSQWNAFDVVDLSNIFDWMDESAVASVAAVLGREMHSGARLVFRQLNHTKNFTPHFAKHFQFEQNFAENILAKDQSLFYSKLTIATKL